MVAGRFRRLGFTLVELFVALAIIAVLIALLIPAIQRVRNSALHVQSINNVKQIGLAMHGYSDTYGSFPRISGANPSTKKFEFSFFVGLLPFLEQGNVYRQFKMRFPGESISADFLIPVLQSPLDPTQPMISATSYAANGSAFNRAASPKTIRDGTSNTIGLAEHYSDKCRRTTFFWAIGSTSGGPKDSSAHRPTFADKKVGDVHPVSNGQSTLASVRGLTFQTAPALKDCDPRLAQAASIQGLLTGIIDGAARTLAPSVSESTYWAMVTPSGGEVFTSPW